jgi:ribose transport system permease protein
LRWQPSFATLDNVGNILTQVSVTGIIAVGLTFDLCAEIDLRSPASPTSPVSRLAISPSRNLREHRQYPAVGPRPLALLPAFLLGLVNALG